MSKFDGILGIDISKATFDVAILIGEKRRKSKKFSNTLEGFEKLTEWLNRQSVERVHVCMEATNIYGHALAVYLHQKGHAVSMKIHAKCLAPTNSRQDCSSTIRLVSHGRLSNCKYLSP